MTAAMRIILGGSTAVTTNSISNGDYLDMAVLEQMYVFDDEQSLYELIEGNTEELNEDEAFVTQAVDYLALNDAAMVLLFE